LASKDIRKSIEDEINFKSVVKKLMQNELYFEIPEGQRLKIRTY
jgi:hypothetical protein